MNPTSISRSLTARQDSDRHMGENPRGLDIDVRVDESNAKRCVATVTLCDEFSGVHGISPAGVLFAAMERLATQIPAILRGDTSNVWVLRNAAITHFRPGCPNEVVMLFGFIEWEASLASRSSFTPKRATAPTGCWPKPITPSCRYR